MKQAIKERDDLVFKALANGDRRTVLDLLRDGPRTTAEVCKAVPRLNRCTVMQHLTALEQAGLVVSKKRGRCRWNYLDVAPIQRIYDRWISDYAAPAATLLTRLREDLEGSGG